MFDFSVERFTKMLKLMSLRHKSAALPKASPTAKKVREHSENGSI
jgi:hypothetical protein